MSGQTPEPFDTFIAKTISDCIGRLDNRTYGPPESLDSHKRPYGDRTGDVPDYRARASDGTFILLEHKRLFRHSVGFGLRARKRLEKAVRFAHAGLDPNRTYYFVFEPGFRVPSEKECRGDPAAVGLWTSLINALRDVTMRAIEIGPPYVSEKDPKVTLIITQHEQGRPNLDFTIDEKRTNAVREVVRFVNSAEKKFATAESRTQTRPTRAILVGIAGPFTVCRGEIHPFLDGFQARGRTSHVTDVFALELRADVAGLHWLWPEDNSMERFTLSPEEQAQAFSYLLTPGVPGTSMGPSCLKVGHPSNGH